MKRPLVPVALCYTAGVLCAEFLPAFPIFVLFAWSFVILLVTLLWPKHRAVWLGVLLVLCGWTNLTSRTAIVSPYDLRVFVSEAGRFAGVRGTLAETPSLRVFVQDDAESFRSLVAVDVEAIQLNGEWKRASGRVMLITPGVLSGEFFSGQTIEASGALLPPASAVAEGLFDYRKHLARQGIYFQLKLREATACVVLSTNRARPLTDRFVSWASGVLARGMPVEDEELRLNWAMVLGWKTALTNEVSAPFMRSGTMHIFAISGLHIALIAGILLAVLRVARLSRLWCGLLVIPLIWFYTAATGWQSSAIRSTVMMTVIIGGWSLHRPSDLLNSLAMAGFAILLWQPEQLFQPSFQLSFFVVLSIALFFPPLEKLRHRLLKTDPLLPRELLPTWRRWLDTPLRWLGTCLATSIAAWIGSMPLTLLYFHLFSPVTLLANLIVVPLSSGALAAALGSLACGAWWPGLAELFNHSAWLAMKCMIAVSEWTTTLPGAYLYSAAPPWWLFVAYYGLLIGLLSRKIFQPQWRRITLGAAAFFLILATRDLLHARRDFTITVLPLSGGHATLVDGPGRSNDWLVDCGASNSVQFVTTPFLRGQGVNTLARIALTHGDIREVGGFELLRSEFKVGAVFHGATRFRSPTYRKIMASLEDPSSAHVTIARGDSVGPWQILHPASEDKFPQADDASLVMLGTFRSARMLSCGDLGRPGQEELMKRTNDLRADIVVSGLPERGEPLCEALLERVQPKLIIVADSEFPATKRANATLRQRLAQTGIPVLYTRECGAVTITIEPGRWRYSVARGGVNINERPLSSR